jgi:hypothetical protein
VERLTRHLDNGIPKEALFSYLSMVRSWAPSAPVIHVDDSDVVKPDGYKFEALGMVRDGSRSSSSKTVYTKGYHVTEACVMTTEGNPISIFSKIHSSAETSYTSINDATFSALERGASIFEKATFAMDRGYDDNKIFLKLDELKQQLYMGIHHMIQDMRNHRELESWAEKLVDDNFQGLLQAMDSECERLLRDTEANMAAIQETISANETHRQQIRQSCEEARNTLDQICQDLKPLTRKLTQDLEFSLT